MIYLLTASVNLLIIKYVRVARKLQNHAPMKITQNDN